MLDTYADARVALLLSPLNFATDTESLLVDLQGFHGKVQVVILATEDASLAITNKLDITAHIVPSDSEAPVTGNQVGEAAQIIAQNSGTPDAIERRFAIDMLDDVVNDTTDRYLQLNFVETGTWEGEIAAFAVLGNRASLPATAAVASPDPTYANIGGLT